MNKNEQRRFILGAEIRADKSGEQMTIHARAVKYNSKSKPGVPARGMVERITPGCFARSLQNGDDTKCLLNHDPNFLLGRVENQSLRLIDSKDSLRFEVRLNPNISFHRDTYNLVKDGTLSECSFGFSVDADGDSYEQEKDERGQACVVRSVRSAKLFDVSIVNDPAYGNGATSAEARSLRSMYEFAPEENTDVDLAARVAALAAIVRADNEATLQDARNIVRAQQLLGEILRDEKRAEFEALKADLGL